MSDEQAGARQAGPRVVKVPCARCDQITNHEVLYQHVEDGTEGDGQYWEYQWWAIDEMVQCRGCDSVSYRKYAYADWEDESHVTRRVYPPRKPGLEDLERDIKRQMPLSVRNMYEETRNALLADARVLSAAGLRGTVEALCVDADVGGRNLEAKIDGLASKGVLTERQATYLHSHRFIGNAALHEFVPPPSEELVKAFDVLTHLLRVMYGLPRRTP